MAISTDQAAVSTRDDRLGRVLTASPARLAVLASALPAR